MVGFQGKAPWGEGRLSDTPHMRRGSYPPGGDEQASVLQGRQAGASVVVQFDRFGKDSPHARRQLGGLQRCGPDQGGVRVPWQRQDPEPGTTPPQ